jgi:hypothetical protein
MGLLNFELLLVNFIDALPAILLRGFWGQTAIAGTAHLTSPNPMDNALHMDLSYHNRWRKPSRTLREASYAVALPSIGYEFGN